MGLYDTVTLRCPVCKSKVHTQTKAGSCDLIEYNSIVPADIAYDLVTFDRHLACSSCHVKLSVNSMIDLERVQLYLVEVDNNET